MDNLMDLFERVNDSSMDKDVQAFLKAVIESVSENRPQAALEQLVDGFVKEADLENQ